MSAIDSIKESGGRIVEWAKAHPVLAGVIVFLLVVVGYFIYKKTGFGVVSSSEPGTIKGEDEGTTEGGMGEGSIATIGDLPGAGDLFSQFPSLNPGSSSAPGGAVYSPTPYYAPATYEVPAYMAGTPLAPLIEKMDLSVVRSAVSNVANAISGRSGQRGPTQAGSAAGHRAEAVSLNQALTGATSGHGRNTTPIRTTAPATSGPPRINQNLQPVTRPAVRME